MELKWWHIGLIMPLAMAGVISLYASPQPDGLERIAKDEGFLEIGEGHEMVKSPMPDYVIPGITNETLAASLARLVGTIFMFLAVIMLGKLLKKEEAHQSQFD